MGRKRTLANAERTADIARLAIEIGRSGNGQIAPSRRHDDGNRYVRDGWKADDGRGRKRTWRPR